MVLTGSLVFVLSLLRPRTALPRPPASVPWMDPLPDVTRVSSWRLNQGLFMEASENIASMRTSVGGRARLLEAHVRVCTAGTKSQGASPTSVVRKTQPGPPLVRLVSEQLRCLCGGQLRGPLFALTFGLWRGWSQSEAIKTSC